jgi:hypothetical protein
MKLAATILLVMSGVLFAQNTNDPTDTPTVSALTALLPLRDQANYGRWLVGQTKSAGTAKFVAALSRPALLLQVKGDVDRPNYGGNAFEEVKKNAWLRFAKGNLQLE